jgi:hypothetical protein
MVTEMKNKKMSFDEAQSIAKDSAIKKLQASDFPREALRGLMINFTESNDETVMELYKPGLRPIDAEVLLVIKVNMFDGNVTFLPDNLASLLKKSG